MKSYLYHTLMSLFRSGSVEPRNGVLEFYCCILPVSVVSHRPICNCCNPSLEDVGGSKHNPKRTTESSAYKSNLSLNMFIHERWRKDEVIRTLVTTSSVMQLANISRAVLANCWDFAGLRIATISFARHKQTTFYIYIYICVCRFICVYDIFIYMCVCIFLHTNTCACVSVCICKYIICIWLYMCVYMHAHTQYILI